MDFNETVEVLNEIDPLSPNESHRPWNREILHQIKALIQFEKDQQDKIANLSDVTLGDDNKAIKTPTLNLVENLINYYVPLSNRLTP
jgi:hypothetical protein